MAAVSPTLKIRCPYCWNEFHPGDCAVVSTMSGRLLRPRPMPGTEEHSRSRTWIEDLTGPVMALELPVRLCPWCNKELFEGIEECRTINIAIIGDTGSGKSHFIALLIDQIQHGELTKHGGALSRIMPLNRFTIDTYRDMYYNPVIRDHVAIDATY